MQTQQQIDQAQNRSIKILERKFEVQEYIKRNYQAATLGLYGKELVESFKNLFNRNLSIWKTVLNTTTSGYAYAHQNFIHVKQVQARQQFARQQMVANIIGTYAAMGFGWFGPAVRGAIKHTLPQQKSQSVEQYFSSGFEQIIKNSGITFNGLPEVRFDRQKDLIQTDIDSVLKPTIVFKNDLDRSFDRCARKVTAQLDHMIQELNDNESETNSRILKQFGDFQADAQNLTIPLHHIYSRIDKAYGKIKAMVRDMNAHLIESAYYFRMKPGFNLDDEKVDKRFTAIMAAFFERAMWAGWIPHQLKTKTWAQVPKFMLPPPRYTGTWQESDYFRLKELKPGCYRSLSGSFDIQVSSDYHKPSKTLVQRLEKLQVIKTKDHGLVDSATLTQDKIARVENLGCYVSDRDVQHLIAWAQQECTKLSPYGLSQFPFVQRGKNALWLPQLS